MVMDESVYAAGAIVETPLAAATHDTLPMGTETASRKRSLPDDAIGDVICGEFTPANKLTKITLPCLAVFGACDLTKEFDEEDDGSFEFEDSEEEVSEQDEIDEAVTDPAGGIWLDDDGDGDLQILAFPRSGVPDMSDSGSSQEEEDVVDVYDVDVCGVPGSSVSLNDARPHADIGIVKTTNGSASTSTQGTLVSVPDDDNGPTKVGADDKAAQSVPLAKEDKCKHAESITCVAASSLEKKDAPVLCGHAPEDSTDLTRTGGTTLRHEQSSAVSDIISMDWV